MKLRLTLAILLIAPIAGCVTAPDVPTPGEPLAPGESSTLPWGLSDCGFYIAIVTVDAAKLAPHLPEGFRALSPAEAGLPPDPRGDALLAMEAFRCQGAVGLDGNVSDASYGSFFTWVEPPAELRDPDATPTFEFVKWDVLVADDALRARLAEAGVPAHDGEVAFNILPSVATTTLTMNGTTYAADFAYPPTSTDTMDVTFVEYTPTPNGIVTWKASAAGNSALAAGTITVPAGSFPHGIIGAERAQAAVLIVESPGGFVDATITLPTT